MDSDCRQRLDEITQKFQSCRKAMSALGDETRQLMVLMLLESGPDGVRVGEIARKIHLSRPSVSHHLRVLREAEIVSLRREGTKNYYYLDARESQWRTLNDLTQLVYEGIGHWNRSEPRP